MVPGGWAHWLKPRGTRRREQTRAGGYSGFRKLRNLRKLRVC